MEEINNNLREDKMKIQRIVILSVLALSIMVTSALAHCEVDSNSTTMTMGEESPHGNDKLVQHALSLHEKIDEFLNTASDNHLFAVAFKDCTDQDTLLDVRENGQYQTVTKNVIHIPFSSLHSGLKKLDVQKKVYVISESNIRSAYAVFILRLHGINAWLVQDYPGI
jgi:rhodanese-related sulfurtransferase